MHQFDADPTVISRYELGYIVFATAAYLAFATMTAAMGYISYKLLSCAFLALCGGINVLI